MNIGLRKVKEIVNWMYLVNLSLWKMFQTSVTMRDFMSVGLIKIKKLWTEFIK